MEISDLQEHEATNLPEAQPVLVGGGGAGELVTAGAGFGAGAGLAAEKETIKKRMAWAIWNFMPA